jgi:hypothetical protein
MEPFLTHHVHDAVVGEVRHRQARHVRQSRAVVQRRQHQAGLGQDPQRGLDALPLVALAGLAQSALHRRQQPLQAPLEHVVGRAALEGLDRQLFPQVARDEDKGQLRAQLARQVQSRHAVEAGQRIVGQDQVEAALTQRGDEVVARLHMAHGAAQTVAVEPVGDQVRVQRAVL